MKLHQLFEAQIQVSQKELKDSISDLLKNVTIDNTHDIPYVAGYSRSGDTIYIDKSIPKFIKFKNNKLVNIHRYLTVHEILEKTLLRTHKMNYPHAHQIALRLERESVEDDNVSWEEYDYTMQKYIKDVGSRSTYPNIPKDLDLTPYRDEKDVKLLKMIKNK